MIAPAKSRAVPSVGAPVVDYTVVLVLAGAVRFPVVETAVKRLGEDLFEPGPNRAAAHAVIDGRLPDLFWLSRKEKAIFNETLQWVGTIDIPHSPEWMLEFVKVQAEKNFQALFAGMLRWSADEIAAGQSIAWVRRQVSRAFDIAEGLVPLDPLNPWGATT